jgi:hypothetical protein
MNLEEQRDLGIKLATELGAAKTLAALNDKDVCFKDILPTAAAEIGMDKFVSIILQNDPSWAAKTLASVPNLGDYRNQLVKKAAENETAALDALRNAGDLGDHQELIAASVGSFGATQGDIAGFVLLDQGGYNCEFTMYWSNNGVTYPTDNSKAVWSDKIMLGQSTNKKCSEFATADYPLQPGNEVWMYMWVQAGKDIESPLRFTYNPNTSNYAYFTSSGTTTIDNLGFNQIAPLPAAAA